MLYTDNLPNVKVIPISDLKAGHIIANLGKVLEIDENDHTFCLVIRRMKENQVMRFSKKQYLIIMPPETDISDGD